MASFYLSGGGSLISSELLKKYNCYDSLESAKEVHGDSVDTEIVFYKTFLNVTDYIPTKIMEMKLLNKECTDYSAELEAREFARSRIDFLKGE